MRENSPNLDYEQTSPTLLPDGADIALNLADPRLSSREEGHALAELDRTKNNLEREHNGRLALEREKKQAEEFLKTTQGQMGRIAQLTVQLRRERAEGVQSDYGLTAE